MKYYAELTPLNADKIGVSAHGQAEFEVDEEKNNLHIKIEMFNTPKNIEHWQHFHGFPDGQDATVATMTDAGEDGWVDLLDTEDKSGTTMVPFDAQPAKMDIANNTYPVADNEGHYLYEKDVPLNELNANFEKVFPGAQLDLDKRVVYIHGVPKSLHLPNTVKGKINDTYDQHVTLPIAVGKIKKER